MVNNKIHESYESPKERKKERKNQSKRKIFPQNHKSFQSSETEKIKLKIYS